MTVDELRVRFNIPAALLDTAGVHQATDTEVRGLLGIRGRDGQDLTGIVFPYRDPRGGRVFGHRVRLDVPTMDGTKYLSEQSCRHLFFAPIPVSDLTDPTVTAVVVEAEKSALTIGALADRCGLSLGDGSLSSSADRACGTAADQAETLM